MTRRENTIHLFRRRCTSGAVAVNAWWDGKQDASGVWHIRLHGDMIRSDYWTAPDEQLMQKLASSIADWSLFVDALAQFAEDQPSLAQSAAATQERP